MTMTMRATLTIATSISLLLLAFAAPTNASYHHLCANDHGVYMGLAVDEESYESVPGQKAPDGEKKDDDNKKADDFVQEWKLVHEKRDNETEPEDHRTPQHSLAGKFLQVRPIKGRLYPSYEGHLLHHVKHLFEEAPYVSFHLRVNASNVGLHTAFLRWTGGRDSGGSDSLFLVMMDKDGSNVFPGIRSLKPAMRGIANEDSGFQGCCYDNSTHFCSCFTEVPTNKTCSGLERFTTSKAKEFGVQCAVGDRMEFVDEPNWYLFAGLEPGGEVRDFGSEPWDATCEAQGSNTADSGNDFSMWYITDPGDYQLRVYAREDGTALDAIYVAGPHGKAPDGITQYKAGDSTLCSEDDGGSGSGDSSSKKKRGRHGFLHFIFWCLVLGGLGYFFVKTERGQELVVLARQYIDSVRGRNAVPQYDSSRYEPLGMNPN